MGGAILVTGNNNVIGGTGAGDTNVVGNSTIGRCDRASTTATATRFSETSSAWTAAASRDRTSSAFAVRPFGGDANNNVIGGDTPAAENTIWRWTNGAILITGAAASGNRVFGNNGSNNGGLFVDIGGADINLGDSAGNLSNRNGGVRERVIIAGDGDDARRVRYHNDQRDRPRLRGARGADSTERVAGNASARRPPMGPATGRSPIRRRFRTTRMSPPTRRLRRQLGKLTNIVLSTDATPPETSMDSGPSGPTANAQRRRFTFSSNEAGGAFECAIDSGGFSACVLGIMVGPASGDGRAPYYVRARDAAANLDASPATPTSPVDTSAARYVDHVGPGEA